MNEEPDNFVRVSLKKSSSTGKIGYDIVAQSTIANQERLDAMADVAMKTALKVRTILESGI